MKKVIYTALVSKQNVDLCEKENCYCTIINKKTCLYDKDYQVIEFSVESDLPGDYDIEVIINTLGALIVHESLTNGFMALEEDLKEITSIYNWTNAGECTYEELLSTEDKNHLIELMCKQKNIKEEDLYLLANNDKQKWYKYTDIKDKIFDKDFSAFKLTGEKNQTSLWIPFLIDEYYDYSFFIQKDSEDPFEEDDEDDEDEYAMMMDLYKSYDNYDDYDSYNHYSNYAEDRLAWGQKIC